MDWRAEAIGFLRDYGPILFGLGVGALARIGLMRQTGEHISWPMISGFLMQLGLVGLVAAVSSRVLNIAADDVRALLAGILALACELVVQRLRERGWQSIAGASVPGGMAELRQDEARRDAMRSLTRDITTEEDVEALERRLRERQKQLPENDDD